MHRRYRQIARLIYHYCCVRYMKRVDGRWVEDDNLRMRNGSEVPATAHGTAGT